MNLFTPEDTLKFILSLDQGITSSRAIVFDREVPNSVPDYFASTLRARLFPD
jgi:glycerol kinase